MYPPTFIHSMLAILLLAAWALAAEEPIPADALPSGEMEDMPEFERVDPPPITPFHDPIVAVDEAPRPTDRPSPIDFERVGAEMRGMAREEAGEDGASNLLNQRRSGPNYWKVVASLCLVLGLILLLSYLLRRFGKGTPLMAGDDLGKILGRIHLTPRASLHFVRAGGRVLVVGVAPNQVSLVAEFDAAAFPAPANQVPGVDVPPPDAEKAHVVRFLDHLHQKASQPADSGTSHAVSEDEIDQLRSQIKRLQDYLKEGQRGDPKP